MFFTDEDKTRAESAMTHQEWLMLYASARASADRAPYHEASTAYNNLADKCMTRANALREGRVMP